MDMISQPRNTGEGRPKLKDTRARRARPAAAFRSGLTVFFDDELLATLRTCCTIADVQLLLCGAAEIDAKNV